MDFTPFLVGGGEESFESDPCFLGIRESFPFLAVICKNIDFENKSEGVVDSLD